GACDKNPANCIDIKKKGGNMLPPFVIFAGCYGFYGWRSYRRESITPATGGAQCRARIHWIAAFRSSSLILSAGCGIIGTSPQTPAPPWRTLSNNLPGALASPWYLA